MVPRYSTHAKSGRYMVPGMLSFLSFCFCSSQKKNRALIALSLPYIVVTQIRGHILWQALLPPPHYGFCLGRRFYREKTSAISPLSSTGFEPYTPSPPLFTTAVCFLRSSNAVRVAAAAAAGSAMTPTTAVGSIRRPVATGRSAVDPPSPGTPSG